MFDAIIEHLGEILISAVVVLFLVNFIFNDASYNGQKGLLNILGEVPTDEQWDENSHEEPENLNSIISFKYPEIVLTEDVYTTSTDIAYKNTFILKFENGGSYAGSDTGGGFRITLKDILLNGGSVYNETTWDEIYEDEYTNLSAAYFKDTETLYFFSAGNYSLLVEVKFDGGASTIYNIPIPVEVKRS